MLTGTTPNKFSKKKKKGAAFLGTTNLNQTLFLGPLTVLCTFDCTLYSFYSLFHIIFDMCLYLFSTWMVERFLEKGTIVKSSLKPWNNSSQLKS